MNWIILHLGSDHLSVQRLFITKLLNLMLKNYQLDQQTSISVNL